MRKKIILSILVLILFWIIFYTPLWLGHRHIGWDFDGYNYPLDYFVYNSIKQDGILPIWDQYIYNGSNFVGNIQTALFSPIKLLFLSFFALSGLEINLFTYQGYYLLHVLLFSIFGYLVVRKISKNEYLSVFAAILLTYNGFFQGQLQHYYFFATFVWLPLVLYGFYFGILGKSRKSLGLFIASYSLMFFAGFPPLFLTVSLFSFSFLTIIKILNDKKNFKFTEIVLRGLLSLIIVLGLVSIQLLPFISSIQDSAASIRTETMPYQYLFTFISPDYWGHLGNYRGKFDLSITYYFSGAFFLAYLLIPVVFLKSKNKKLIFMLVTLFGFVGITIFLSFYPILRQLSENHNIFSYLRPITITAIFIITLLLSSVFVLNEALKTKYANFAFLIMGVTVGLLFFNMPNTFNTPGLGTDVPELQMMGDIQTHQQIISDSPMYLLLVEQNSLRSYLDNWPRIYGVRSLSGHDPIVNKVYLTRLAKYGQVTSAGKRLEMKNIPDFKWLADNGVKYFIIDEKNSKFSVGAQENLSQIYSDNFYNVYELENPRPIFSSLDNCAEELKYHLESGEIRLNYITNKQNCIVRSTMELDSDWKVSDHNVELVRLEENLGFELVNKTEGEINLVLKYDNSYYKVGTFLSISTATIYVGFLIFSCRKKLLRK